MSSQPARVVASHEKWLEQAKRDLGAVRSLHAAGHFEWACFVASQAVEKALKGCLEAMDMSWAHYRGRDGHDLEKLTGLWPNFLRIDDSELADAITQLNQLSEDTRYPSERTDPATKQRTERRFPWEVYATEDASRAIANAERLLVFFEGFISNKLPALQRFMKPATGVPTAEPP